MRLPVQQSQTTDMTVLIALLLLPALCTGSSWPGSVIHSDDGPIQGSHDILTGVTSFHGVPFAAAPTGDLRWKAPERPTPWTKTRKTTSPVHQCPQFDLIKGIRLGEEDCASPPQVHCASLCCAAPTHSSVHSACAAVSNAH